MQPSGVCIAWKQAMRGGGHQYWDLGKPREPCDFEAATTPLSTSGNDIAVLVSACADAEKAVAASDMRDFRAVVRVSRPGTYPHLIRSAGEAVDLAHVVTDAMRGARDQYPECRRFHLFAAVPAGAAVLIGQLLNTLGPVQTYEHIQTGGTGTYEPAALLVDG